MNIHCIVDISFLYYKYKFSHDSGKLKLLSCKMFEKDEYDNTVEEDVDITVMYHVLKEIEGLRKYYSRNENSVTMSIAFDTGCTRRKEIYPEYKANRKKSLGKVDFDRFYLIERALYWAGHNTYKVEGNEADDIVYSLVELYKDNFDHTVVVTSDADLLVNVDKNVMVQRYKSRTGYSYITDKNFSAYVSAEYKSTVPYNSLLLYKSICGDTSDNIAGVKGFGPGAFTKMINHLAEKDVDFTKLNDVDYLLQAVNEHLSGYLSAASIEQMKFMLLVVKPIILDKDIIVPPERISTKEQRRVAYTCYNMLSLI